MDRSQKLMELEEHTGVKIELKRKINTSPQSSIRKPIFLLSSLVMLGLVLAVGHHSAFEFLNSKPVSAYSQVWINRLSNGNALIVKMCWTLVVGLAFQHTLWQSLRRHYLKIRSIDKLLDLRNNFMGFLSVECFQCAPVTVALATILWLLLALPVVVPGALSVQVQSNGFTRSIPCTVPIFGRGGQVSVEIPNQEPNETAHHDFIFSAYQTPQILKLVDDIVLGIGVAFFSSPCGPNCTYQLVFSGPGLDCESHPNYMMSARYPGDQNVSFYNASSKISLNTSASPENLPHKWITPGSRNFLEQTNFPIYAATAPVIYDSNFSTLWIQYLNHDSASQISIPSMMSLEPLQVDKAWRTLACTLQNTTYVMRVHFIDGVPTVNAKMISSTPLSITSQTEYLGDQNAQYLDPTAALFSSLSGSIYAYNWNHSIIGPLVMNTKVPLSNLVNLTMAPETLTGNLCWSVTSNFTTVIPELLTNITINIMAANRPTYNTTCNSTRTEIVYQYKSQYLLLTYGLGLLATLCCFAAGVCALRDNGVAMDTTFSEIVAATQNPALGQTLADEGYSTAARESAAYLEQRIMYGELVEEDGNEDRSGSSKGERRAAFGLKGQVAKMEKAL